MEMSSTSNTISKSFRSPIKATGRRSNESPDKKSFRSNNNDSMRYKAKRRKNKKRVTFSENFVNIIEVESFKPYNMENTHIDPYVSKDKTRCNCMLL